MRVTEANSTRFALFLAALLALSWLVMYGAGLLSTHYHIQIPMWVDMPGTLGVFAFLFKGFDRWVWRLPVFRALGITDPDFSGKWTGTLKSSHDSFAQALPVELRIQQTATDLKVLGVFNSSKSCSVTASFEKLNGETSLLFFYRNDPAYNAGATMAMHDGACKLTYDESTRKFTGYYFSGRNRNNHGIIELMKV